jgi:hypothetical protein
MAWFSPGVKDNKEYRTKVMPIPLDALPRTSDVVSFDRALA